jgi:hypothetical protein
VYKNRGSVDDGGRGERCVWVVLVSRVAFRNVGRGLVSGDREERGSREALIGERRIV